MCAIDDTLPRSFVRRTIASIIINESRESETPTVLHGELFFGVPQPRRSASRNRAVESAPGEQDSSVSFNGAELTAELSPTLRPKASLIGGGILRSLPRCTAKIPAN